MAESDLYTVRELVLDLIDDKRLDWQRPPWEETVAEWFGRRPDLLADLGAVGRPDSCRPTRDHGLLEGLYALDRLSDLMILPWSPAYVRLRGDGQTQSAWLDLIELIGAVMIAEDDYHPFFHEIVEVLPDDDPETAPVLLKEHWPGAMLGSMLLKRAGVTVMAGSHRMDRDVTTQSTLYWAWQRRIRPTRDLSVGWGHNSQWRTNFRRDYVLGDDLLYNVDALLEQGQSRPKIDPDVELELLRYRHGLLTDPGRDQWPWDTTLVESRIPGNPASPSNAGRAQP